MSSRRLLWVTLSLAILFFAAVAQAAAPKESDFSSADVDSGKALTSLNQMASTNTDAVTPKKLRRQTTAAKCNKANLRVRKEWRNVPKPDRKSYIAAVQCLQTKPSLLDPAQFPGSKSIFDDFVVIHLLQTLNIHLTGTFLTWHRYFTWAFEEQLRSKCGYTGTVPYWEWGFDVKNPAASPVFDGSDTSMGSDGAFFSHPGLILTEPLDPTRLLPLPPGTGGGCVKSGPFSTMKVHIGPIALAQYGTPNTTGVPDPFNDHSRCLKRDLNPGVAQKWTTFRNTTQLILQNTNIEKFQAIMQADPRYIHGSLGVHGGGHFTIGGDPGSDPFISPGDPAFYLHHSQIDRVYWIWQMLDYNNRKNVFGTRTFMNSPPSDPVTLDDVIDISPLAPPVKVRDLMSTVGVGGGPLCYVYA